MATYVGGCIDSILVEDCALSEREVALRYDGCRFSIGNSRNSLAKGLVWFWDSKGRRILTPPDEGDLELTEREAGELAVIDDADARSVWPD